MSTDGPRVSTASNNLLLGFLAGTVSTVIGGIVVAVILSQMDLIPRAHVRIYNLNVVMVDQGVPNRVLIEFQAENDGQYIARECRAYYKDVTHDGKVIAFATSVHGLASGQKEKYGSIFTYGSETHMTIAVWLSCVNADSAPLLYNLHLYPGSGGSGDASG